MTDWNMDIAEKLRLKQVVDQSSVTIPPQHSVGDLPTIFSEHFKRENMPSISNINDREAATCALLSAMGKVDYKSTLNDFVAEFVVQYLMLKSSVKGFRSKQLASICGGNVQFERKLEFARLKGKKDEDFV